MAQHPENQLFLVFPVDCPAVPAEDMYLLGGKLVRKGRKALIERSAVAPEDDDHAADALMHGHMLHARKRRQIRLQQIRLLHAHERPDGAQANAPRAFVQNLKFHQTFAASSMYAASRSAALASLIAFASARMSEQFSCTLSTSRMT